MAAEKKETILALIGGGKGPKGPPAAEEDPDGDGMPMKGEDKSPLDKGVDDDGEEQIAADEVMEAFEAKDSVALKDALSSFIKICMTKY